MTPSSRRPGLAALVIGGLASSAGAASFFPSSAFSDGAAGTTSAAFLKVPASARAEAIGGSYAAAAGDSESVFWQPAGLARLEESGRADASLSYNMLLAGSYTGAMAFAQPIPGWGVLGAGLAYFSAGSVQGYDALENKTSAFTPNDFALTASYGKKFASFNAGASLKLIHSKVGDASGTDAAVDLGIQIPRVADFGEGPVDAGASLLNVGPPMHIGSANDPLPMALSAGFLWHVTPNLAGILEGHMPVDQDPYPGLGLEWSQPITDSFRGAIRAGYNVARARGVDGLAGMTVGLGLDIQRFRFDYAWSPQGDLGTTNRLSLGFAF